MLTTPVEEHWKDIKKNGLESKSLAKEKANWEDAEFGMLLISHVGIYFCKEKPCNWMDRSGKSEFEF